MHDVSLLLQALPYIRAFRDKLFVIKLGGELVRDPDHLDAIAKDLTLVHMVGVKLIVVHGGGPQATELSELLGLKPTMVDGRRVTDAQTLEVAKMVFAGKINTDMLSALARHGARAVGLSGVDAALISAKRRPVTTVQGKEGPRQVDFGFVGDVEAVNPALLSTLIDRGYLPVVCSLAVDAEGTILNVNADTIATEIAIHMKAEKLISLTAAEGVCRNFGTPQQELISVLTAAEARRLIADGTASKGMKPKLESLIRAVQQGVREAHIIDGLTQHSLLLEIFTDKGIGTMLVDKEPVRVDEAALGALPR
jgi:acetylglutamate kinase